MENQKLIHWKPGNSAELSKKLEPVSSLAYTEQFKTFKVTKLAESYSMFREFFRNMQIIHTLCRLLLI